jgi:hypothetical protein
LSTRTLTFANSVMSWVSSGFLSEFLALRAIASLEIESANFDRLD